MAHEAAKAQREITPEAWQRVRDILANALELPANERSEYLQHACGDDSLLRARIDELIAAHDATGAAALDAAAFPITSSDVSHSEPSHAVIGRRIGTYRIEAEIAHGGMGTVFRAVRADDEFKKQVAIKLMGGAAFSNHASEMFRRERQVLANLEHPNIARLLDGGTTEEGSPYLVMEYVEGETVTNYCEFHHLSIEDKLKLFRKICSAVQYAHQNLVIHRDLKPANILVTKDGEPKLLDFGIAKIIDLDANTNLTVTAWQALTPAYASPEQISGEPITTTTDVYSLGLVLYELLTGQQAFPVGKLSPLQMQRVILEEDPELPSKAVLRCASSNREQLSTQLKGDLDSIVAKAIRKVRAERYSSVEQLAEDIRRHLEKLPVLAHGDSVQYRLLKFSRRHVTGFVAAGVVFVSVVTGILLAAHEARIARAQQARAEQRFNDVRKLANSLLFDLHDAIQDLPGSTPARKLIVEKSLQYLDSLSSQGVSDPGLLRELATAYERVGELQGHYLADNLGETSNSMASYRKALSIRQQLGERRQAESQDRLSLAESYRRMASQLSALNDTRGALADVEKATAIAESLAKIDPANSKVLYELGFDYEVLGNVQAQSFSQGWGDLNVALETYSKAVAVDQKMLSLDASSLAAQRGLALDLLQIGNTQSDLDRFQDAANTFNRSLKIFVSITQRSTAVRDRRRVAVVYNELGMVYDKAGSWKVSLENHEQGLKIYKQLAAEDPKNALLRQGLAIALVNTGDGKSKLGRFAEGRADITEGIAIMKTLMTDPNAQQRQILAQMHMTLADSLARSHQPSESLHEYQTALDIYESLHPSPADAGMQLNLATCKVGIANAEQLTKQTEGAATDFNEVLKLAAASVQKKNREALRDAAQAYAGLGDIEVAKATHSHSPETEIHWKNAIESYRQSLELGKEIPPFAQIDPNGFRAAEISRRLQQAESHLTKYAP